MGGGSQVFIHKEIAVVWAKYDFHREGEFSHCGVDAFNLLKTPEGWKISEIIYTSRKKDVKRVPLAFRKRKAKNN